MRVAFRNDLTVLMGGLVRMSRLTAQMMTTASIALHQADPALAARVITDRDRLLGTIEDAKRRCITLLALQAPVAGDLRIVVAALRVVGHLRRMGDLARHIALIVRLKHPNPVISGQVRPILARMSLLASQQAEDAATAIAHQDPLSGCRLAVAGDELGVLLGQLFGILFAPDWSHSVEQAVDAALIGRYYERFGDHAVAIAQQVCYIATGQASEVTALAAANSPTPASP